MLIEASVENGRKLSNSYIFYNMLALIIFKISTSLIETRARWYSTFTTSNVKTGYCLSSKYTRFFLSVFNPTKLSEDKKHGTEAW